MSRDNVPESIGSNVRRIRTQRGISVSELARRSGVARGTLTKLEAGVGNPTAETLWALADALGVGIGSMFAVEAVEARVVRREDAAWLRLPNLDGRLVDRMMIGPDVLEVWESRHLNDAPFRTDQPPGRVPGTVEHWFVTSGCLRMGPEGGEQVELRQGDYIRFVIDRPYVFQGVGGAADVLMIVRYPPPAGTAGD